MSDSLTTEVYLGPGGAKSLELEALKSATTPRFLVGLLVRDGLERLRSGRMRVVNPAVPGDTESTPPVPLQLDIGGMLTGSEALQLDTLALQQGVQTEALVASAVRRLLNRERRSNQNFRLRMPRKMKRQLEEYAESLGCGAGELAAFLLSERAGRPQATVAGGCSG